MALPTRIEEDTIDDIQSIETDLEALIAQFIQPIEKLRSNSAPAILDPSRVASSEEEINKTLQNDLNNTSFDNNEPQESRAHAFYRMIGFPAISDNFSIFNPGFNPNLTSTARQENEAIASQIPNSIKVMTAFRENSARRRLTTFKKQGLEASILTTVLFLTRQFQVINTNLDFTQQDNQSFSIPRRKAFIRTLYERADGEEITRFFENDTHILRPFTVDPVIEKTVMPASHKICQPFLQDKNATKLERNRFAPRPGIELILRLRLKQQQARDENFVSQTLSVLDSNVVTGDISLADLRRIVEALLNDNNINDEEILEAIGRPSDLELANINKLVKLVRGLVRKKIEAIETVASTRKRISWTPIASERGPEFGVDLAGFLRTKKIKFELDRRIKFLTIKQRQAKKQGITSDEDIGNFSISNFINIEKLFSEELSAAQSEKEDLVRGASEALRAIEIISGEISGLGLIDILAIYISLWSVDLDVLLSLLDNNAFNRLYNFNPDLRTEAVERRRGSGSPALSPFEAIQAFESQVINILSFADKLFVQEVTGIPQSK